jgi:hypothetical protein
VAVHQLKITLLETVPPVWRRVQVRSDTTLAELHAVIQVAMGWEGYDLHSFGCMTWLGYCPADDANETMSLREIAPTPEWQLVVEEEKQNEGSCRCPREILRLTAAVHDMATANDKPTAGGEGVP